MDIMQTEDDAVRAVDAELEEFIASRIEASPLVDQPWPHIIIRDILPGETYAAFRENTAAFPLIHESGLRRHGFVPRGESSVVDAFDSFAVKKALEDKLGFYGFPWPRLVHDLEGYSYHVHADVETKAGTLQLYLTEETVEGYGTRLHWGSRFVSEVPYAPNVAYAFKRTSASFHSTGTIGAWPRRSLLIPYMNTDRREP